MNKLFVIVAAAILLLCACAGGNISAGAGTVDASALTEPVTVPTETLSAEHTAIIEASEEHEMKSVTVGDAVIPAYPVPALEADITSPKNTSLVIAAQNDGSRNTMSDFIGANHIWSHYSLLGHDALTEGAMQTRSLGSSTIKVYLTNYYDKNYPCATPWGDTVYGSPAELADHEFFRSVFGYEGIDTVIIGSYIFNNSYGHPAVYFINSFTEEARVEEYRAMYELTYYLCRTYAGTGKSFIIQNWESDWACMPEPKAEYDPPQEVFDRLIQWTNTRQDAVMAAREAAGCEGVNVYHALEVNLIAKAIKGSPAVVNRVIPYTYCDFYSYSSYDTAETEDGFSAALDYLSEQVASNRTGGKSGCYIGEFGYPDSLNAELGVRVAKNVLKVAREKGYAHILWWQLYDCISGTFKDGEIYPVSDYMGYWLIDCNGRYTEPWNIFYRAINGSDDPRYSVQVETARPKLPLSLVVSDKLETVGNGMKFLNITYDGTCEICEYEGIPSIVTSEAKGQGYMYFNIDNTVITPDNETLKFTVTYFDGDAGQVRVEYNGADGTVAKSVSWNRTGTGEWRTVTVTLTDAGLNDLFHGGVADIRLNVGAGAPIAVSRVELDIG